MAYFNVSPTAHPQEFKSAVKRVVHFTQGASPAALTRGELWYPAVHDVARTQGHEAGLTLPQSAGIIAAVSPGMDFEQHNIKALEEIRSLRPKDWSAITEDALRKNETGHSATRSPAVKEMLLERAPSLARATNPSLVTAHQILGGMHPDAAMPRRTNPKRNAFFHNIETPHVVSRDSPVTIDGRQADIIANSMRGWEMNRGIGSADLKSGKQTRYEDHESVMRSAAVKLGMPPDMVQAVSWEAGKEFEMSGLTKRGQPRKQGPTRVGQPYLQ